MTYYIENRNADGENEKQSWESDVIEEKNGTRRIEKLKDEKDADETVHKRATRKSFNDSIIFSVRRRL